MEKLIDTAHGLPGILASICVILLFQIIIKLGEFLWKLKREKDQVTEQTLTKFVKAIEENTSAISSLQAQIDQLDQTLSELPKLKLDLRRLYYAIKMITGDKWAKIREEIVKEFDLKDF